MKNILVLLTIFLSAIISLQAQSPMDYCANSSTCTGTFTVRVDTIHVNAFPGSYDIRMYRYRICNGNVEIIDDDGMGHFYTNDYEDYLRTNPNWAALYQEMLRGIEKKVFMLLYNNAGINQFTYQCPNGYLSTTMYVSSCISAVGYINPLTTHFEDFEYRSCTELCCKIETRLCYNITTGLVEVVSETKSPMTLNAGNCAYYSYDQSGNYNFLGQSCSPICE